MFQLFNMYIGNLQLVVLTDGWNYSFNSTAWCPVSNPDSHIGSILNGCVAKDLQCMVLALVSVFAGWPMFISLQCFIWSAENLHSCGGRNGAYSACKCEDFSKIFTTNSEIQNQLNVKIRIGTAYGGWILCIDRKMFKVLQAAKSQNFHWLSGLHAAFASSFWIPTWHWIPKWFSAE